MRRKPPGRSASRRPVSPSQQLVDLLIDQGARQIPIEVKSGQTVASDFFADLDYWRNLAGQASGGAALVYGGEASFKRQGVSVVSWSDWA